MYALIVATIQNRPPWVKLTNHSVSKDERMATFFVALKYAGITSKLNVKPFQVVDLSGNCISLLASMDGFELVCFPRLFSRWLGSSLVSAHVSDGNNRYYWISYEVKVTFLPFESQNTCRNSVVLIHKIHLDISHELVFLEMFWSYLCSIITNELLVGTVILKFLCLRLAVHYCAFQ